jgi:hypothetical protein
MPVNILDKLMYWTKDETSLQFVDNVLREVDQGKIELNKESIDKAQKVMKACFAAQNDELSKACIPFLEKLDGLVAQLPLEGSEGVNVLAKTIREAIRILNERTPFDPPSPIFDLITGYLSRYERAQVHVEVMERVSHATVKDVRCMNEKEIEALGDLILNAFHDQGKNAYQSAIIRTMSHSLRIFFLFSTLDQQDYFFAYIRKKIAVLDHDLFLNLLFQSLPPEMPQLSLGWDSEDQRYLNTEHFALLGDRLTNLEVLRLRKCCGATMEAFFVTLSQGLKLLQQLHLNECVMSTHSLDHLKDRLSGEWMKNILVLNFEKMTFTTSQLVQTLAVNPYARKLQELDLTNVNDWDSCLHELGKTTVLTGLRKLNISRYTGMSDTGVVVIASCPAMANLTQLNFSYSNHVFEEDSLITDYAVVVVAKSPYMANLEELDLSGTVLLTDASVMAIINSPYLKKLKRAKFHGCPEITADAMWQLNRFLSENQGKEEDAAPLAEVALMPYRPDSVVVALGLKGSLSDQ